MERKSPLDITITIINSIIATIFLAFVIFSIYFIAANRGPLYETDSVTIIKKWIYYDQLGGSEEIEVPYIYDRAGRDTFVIESKLPDKLEEGSVISFLNLSDMDVSVDGEVIYSWRKDVVPIWGGAPKNSYFFIDIPVEYAGSTIKISRYDDLNSRFLDVFVGKKDDVIRHLAIKSGVPNFALSTFLLLFSILISACSILLSIIFRKRVHLLKMSLGVLVMSSWLFFDSFVFEFVFRTKFIDGFMAYICTLCMVFPLLSYIDDLQEHIFRKIYFGIYVLELINSIVFILLHITGVLPFIKSLLWLDIVIFFGIAVVFVCTLFDLIKFKNRKYVIFSHGFLCFLLFCMIEIIAINVSLERVQGLYILIGLYVMLGFSIAQEAQDILKIQHERDLATANANARARFLANMSHEIRTPINSILGMNEIIMKEANNSTIESYSNIVNESGQLLLSIINDILDFSKIDAGKHEVVCAPYNPENVINTICSIMKERAENKNLTFTLKQDNNLPQYLLGDSKSLSEVLLNLLSNAVKYTKEGGITFTSECVFDKDKYVLTFKVADTGIGIKESDFESVFDPFSRTDLSKNRSIQGTGLGLAITKQLVEEMGGRLDLKSQYGQGSTFTVILPQAVPTDEEIKLKSESMEDEDSENSDIKLINENYTAKDAKVLVVDDNKTNLIVVKAFLKNTLMTLETAQGGMQAFEMCCKEKYDLILLDHMMPEIDGIETLHMIKEKRESLNVDTPIIILTANAIKGSAEVYKKEGFDNYLSKPVDSKLLIRMVRKYLPVEKVEEI